MLLFITGGACLLLLLLSSCRHPLALPAWHPCSMRRHCSRGVCCVCQHSLVKRGPPTLAPLAPPHCCPSAAVCQARPGTCVFQVGAAAVRVSHARSCVGWVPPAWYGAARCVSGCTAAGVCPVSAGTSRAATATAQQLNELATVGRIGERECS
jgi:hypothetical protein